MKTSLWRPWYRFAAKTGNFQTGLSIPFTLALDAAIILPNGRTFRMDVAAISGQFEKYDNKWVAIDESEEKIVGVGDDAFEATKDAQRRGYSDTILFKVPSFDAALIPLA